MSILSNVRRCWLAIRAIQKNAKLRYELADKLIPFLWGIIKSTYNFKFLDGREVLPLDSKKYKKYKGKIRKQDISVVATNTILYDI